MPFSFIAFPGLSDPGFAVEAAEICSKIWKDLQGELNGEFVDRQKVHFLVIDITPGRREPHELAERLQEFLLEAAGPQPLKRLRLPKDRDCISRLLFVGAKASLDTWEDETGEDRHSRMKALELYVRALQSGHLAHYVNLIKPAQARRLPGVAFSEACSQELVRAELLALDTYYHETRRGLTASKGDTSAARRRERARSRLRPFETGVHDLRVGLAEFLDDVRHSVRGFDPPKPLSGVAPDQQILSDLCAVFQLGKRKTERAYQSLSASSLMRPECNFEEVPEGGAYQLRHQLEQGLDNLLHFRAQGSEELFSPKRPDHAIVPLDASLRLRRYELLRDVSRCVSIGAIDYLKREHRAQNGVADEPKTPKGLLVIDAQLCEELIATHGDVSEAATLSRKSRLLRRLQDVCELIGWKDACWVARAAEVIPGLAMDADKPLDLHDEVPVYDLQSGRRFSTSLQNFSVILIEIDSTGAYVGPTAVQLLARNLESLAAEGGGRSPAPVIVFTQTESFGHIQQSLNLGAVAYVLKERIYQLPFQMRRALEGVLAHRPSTDNASSFRALQVLRPEMIGKLKRHDRNYLVRGRRYHPKPGADQQADASAEQAERVCFDEKELAWIRELPKADLHCHFGTCIAFDAYEVMARNTAGYALSAPDAGDGEDASAPVLAIGAQAADLPEPIRKLASENEGVRETILRLALAVALGEHLCHVANGRLHPLVCLAVGAEVATEGKLGELHKFGLGDKIVEAFRDESAKLQTFEVASLLVALFARDGEARSGKQAELPTPRDYLKAVAGAVDDDFYGHGNGAFRSLDGPESAIRDAATQLTEKLARIARGWNGPDTARYFDDLTNGRDARAYWKLVAARFEERVSRAEVLLDAVRVSTKAWLTGADEQPMIPGWRLTRGEVEARLKAALGRLHVINHIADGEADKAATAREVLSGLASSISGDDTTRKPAPGLSLERYVMLPDRHARHSVSQDKGLQRYLWGADFLGAEHLQYPENILIGAYALTVDNACDNVTYSEVRCETPGYCRGGLSPRDATDLLCLGLDFAAIYLNTAKSSQPLPLVRTSVLLAAKRHKLDEAAREVVSLLEAYLNQKRDFVGVYIDTAPAWWRPTSVVGFDISGNETSNPGWMQTTLEPLKRLSSPITIHAGEAADARSVWNAVYLHHARRIGHGHRLREDRRLLDYCVSEGICMEMCPNSNVFTNAFHPIAWPEQYPLEEANAKSAYPLLAYMRRGLEVTVATDNRYIHNRGFRTLSSEYLTAARLSGGLTRWELLQLVKAGFKNAFLAKRDVAVLVKEMEDRVYRTVSRGWF